jgi:MFS family permease
MTGIVVAGVGVGQMIIPPMVTQIISVYGWRIAFVVAGIMSLVMLALIAQFLRRDPDQVGQLPNGEGDLNREDSVLDNGYSFQEAIYSGEFWKLCGTYFCYGFFVHAILVHIVPHATDLAISAVLAANILAFIGGFGVVGRIGIGSVGDRIGNKQALMIIYILMGLGLFFLQLAKGLWTLYIFAIIFGFAYGGLIVLESPLVGDLFGLRAHGAILGAVHFAATIGGAVSPLLAGLIFDITHSYRMSFLVCAMVSVAGLALSSTLTVPRTKTLVGRDK